MKSLIKLTLLLLLFSQRLSAQDTVVVSDHYAEKYIGKHTATFQDRQKQYSLSQLIANPQLFTRSNKSIINFGANNQNNWIKFYLKNNSNKNRLFLNVDYPDIDSVNLYVVVAAGTDSMVVINGDSLKALQYAMPFYLFEMPVHKGSTVTCFLMLNSNKQIIAPIKMEGEIDTAAYLATSNALSGIYFGIMLAMILYNLFIYFSSGDKHYIYYCNYIFWVFLTQMILLGFSHYNSVLDSRVVTSYALIFVGAMSGIATIIFVKSFLHVKSNAPKYLYVLNSIILGDILAIITLLAGKPTVAYNIVNGVAGIGSLIVLFVALKAYLAKYNPARYFLFGWVFFLGSIIVYVLKDIGVLPYNIFTERSVQIGSALEALLLSFALADKLNMLKKEKEEYQHRALQIAKENERIILEQNTNLQFKVNERTQELKLANDNLNKTLDDLKQAQSQLVESEKMASLGQLTAGIAHEINNPINFVTSNVSPLRRDINILFDTINYIEELAVSDTSTDSKKMQIDEYKEEQEIDYLQTEITHLINGISNGAQRTAEIVKGLRIFSRLDEDNLKHASINEGIDSAVVILNNQLGKIKVIRYYGELPQIECYPGKLNQVFLNVLSNAVYAIHKHFGNKAGGELTITTALEQDKVKISFKDNGIGMDEQTQKKIFDPFFTTKDVGEGTGLGMSIVYTTIRKKHNGSIKVNSSPGKGSEFIIILPVRHDIKMN